MSFISSSLKIISKEKTSYEVKDVACCYIWLYLLTYALLVSWLPWIPHHRGQRSTVIGMSFPPSEEKPHL